MQNSEAHSFWDHLEVLRWSLIRCLGVFFVAAVAVFCCRDFVFANIVMAPAHDDFCLYRLLCRMAVKLSAPSLCPSLGPLEIININLAAQLMVHISVSCFLALLLAVPYILFEAWLFVRPALHADERPLLAKGTLSLLLLFYAGVALSYWIIFPLTLNFLGNYQVSPDVVNRLSLNSYISSLVGLCLAMGLVFEMPVAVGLLARLGILKAGLLVRGRKVAVVICMALAAIITPSTDIFTMMLVALPVYLLYELSIAVARRASRE
ncbi:MAG: twin-arginine translocase subunit TatC [Bacteroidales bacterium]|nr:twin-arginine translocase subunit TatC [Bacteroidales bacterium]